MWAGGAGLGVVMKPGELGIGGCAVEARLALSEGHGGPRALGAGARGIRWLNLRAGPFGA